MMENYESLKINLERLTKNQLNMLKIQELRQQQHKLEMEEAKLSMLNASHQAVNLVDSIATNKPSEEASVAVSGTNLQLCGNELLKENIIKAKENLADQERQLRDSLESFERGLDQSFGSKEMREHSGRRSAKNSPKRKDSGRKSRKS